MIASMIEKLTAQFYEWEVLGRGWILGESPVDLEPPFTPFFGHRLNHVSIPDDGIRHTIFSSLANLFKKEEPARSENFPEITYEPFPFEDDSSLITLRLIFPRNYKTELVKTEQLLKMLSYCRKPVSFELIGNSRTIRLQFVCREPDAQYLKNQLASLYPQLAVLETETDSDLLDQRRALTSIDFGLGEEFMRPLSTIKTATLDPFTGILAIFENLKDDESVMVQVLFSGVVNHWQSSIIRSVSDEKGDAFFLDAPEMLSMAREKIDHCLFAATIRILTQAATIDDAFSLLDKLSFALRINSRSKWNTLIQLPDEEYTLIDRVMDIEYRESHRIGMLLNTAELATFVHLPDASLISRKLLSDIRKTKTAPGLTEGHRHILGLNIHQGVEKSVAIPGNIRLKHTHIIGATGTGKSTLLQNMICQDIENGAGLAVLDPHGDLIENLICFIPAHRQSDVIVFDPSDSEYPIGFNILNAESDIEKEVLASDLVSTFRRLSSSWGDQMNSVLANAILAFLESRRGGTLIDLRRFLIEKPFREEFLKTVTDPNIIYYWQKEFPLLKSTSIGPILTRLDTFLRPRLLRNMVAQERGLEFEEVLNNRKILLIKLSQGLIGAENSYLLGSFVVSKIHQAALARQGKEERNDFFLYIDEFQHFVTASMSHILSGARKYHLGLVLAHQDLHQLQKYDSELLNSVITNACTRICFRLGDADAKKLAEGFSFFEATDLQNLNTGEAIARIERPEYDFSLNTLPFEPTGKIYLPKEEIIKHSRENYGTSKEEVERIIKESIGDTDIPQVSSTKEKLVYSKDERSSEQTKESFSTLQKPKDRPFEVPDETLKLFARKKEETQHRYLQNLIKKMAEEKDYKAIIEAVTPDGQGKVDVLIEDAAFQIACEVSVTTDNNWELHNIKKCLDAGYNLVFVCSTEKKAIDALKQKVKERFDEDTCSRIYITDPEGLFDFLDKRTIGRVTTETKYKGYRVKVEYDSISQEEQRRKRESISRIVLESLRKMKK